MIIIYDIKTYLEDNKVDKAALAKKLGLSKQLFHYHVKKGDPPLSMLVKMADILEVSIDEMILDITMNYIKRKI